MPTVEENKNMWNKKYNWGKAGEEWSLAWRESSVQWYGTILPRIHAFLPVDTILEIAPGFGRWTQFLRNFCNNLILVDLSEKCINACRERFAGNSHITYFVNDGKSLDMISDDTIDFAFSFDSLVHVEDTVNLAYVSQLSRKLKHNGVAFIHHSNLGEYSGYYKIYSKMEKIPRMVSFLKRLGILDEVKSQWRDSGMTAKKMELYAENNGLKCIGQELITWNTKRVLIDCISTIVKKDSIGFSNNKVLRNASFMKEAQYLSELSKLYDQPQQNK